MKTFVIWPVALLAMAATACSKTAEPVEPGKTPQKSSAGGKTESTPKELVVDLGGGVRMEMVLVPAGQFMMGDDKSEYRWEKPVHKVNITMPFYLGKYEVTQEQWKAVMGNIRGRRFPLRSRGPKNPALGVSWNDCQAFLVKLNAKTGEHGGKFVLPTEAQWEYACRAGSTSKFCFGDDADQLGEYAWYGKNSRGKLHPVGEKKPNTFGLYDMHGNAWEWCADKYGSDYYAKSPTDDPRGPTPGTARPASWGRVFRGGGCRYPAAACRSATRSGYEPGPDSFFLGFRVARVPTDK